MRTKTFGIAGLTLALAGSFLVTSPTAVAALNEVKSCTDGGGHVWTGEVQWGDEYVGDDASVKIGNGVTRFKSPAKDATTVDYSIKTYNGSGVLIQTLKADNENYTPGTWRTRNPANAATDPGKVKVIISVGDGNDGKSNCSMTFVQPVSVIASADYINDSDLSRFTWSAYAGATSFTITVVNFEGETYSITRPGPDGGTITASTEYGGTSTVTVKPDNGAAVTLSHVYNG